MLNFFPTKGGISDNLSPKTIMSGETLDYKNYLRLQLGQYFHVHKEENPHKNQVPITKGDICLVPRNNLKGRYKFMDSKTAKKIVRRIWN